MADTGGKEYAVAGYRFRLVGEPIVGADGEAVHVENYRGIPIALGQRIEYTLIPDEPKAVAAGHLCNNCGAPIGEGELKCGYCRSGYAPRAWEIR